MILYYSKSGISEIVIRKSLYWMSDSVEWLLDSDNEQWIIHIDSNEEDAESKIKYTFERLLNDYILREVLDSKTADLKQAIIRKSLKDLSCL